MHELINTSQGRQEQRWQLLATVSAAVLLMWGIGKAEAAADADQPTVWIELGGQLSRLNVDKRRVDAPFFAAVDAVPELDSPLSFERPSRYSIDEYGKVSFQPDADGWTFSAALRYGRSSSKKDIQQQAQRTTVTITGIPSPPPVHSISAPASFEKFADTKWKSSESHTILDFQVGKDVGLGLFGGGSTSEIGFGVRFAQFSSRAKADVNADPTIHYPTHPVSVFGIFKYNVNANIYWEHDYSQRNFRGLGPSLSWQGSMPIAGHPEQAELQFDWNIAAAVLFGRQKASGYHYSSRVHSVHQGALHAAGAPTAFGPYVPHDRSESVTVPNIGGSFGLSFRSDEAKVSFGYRADLFFNAMDTGIDARNSSNVLFHGPYASVSIGLGG